MESEHDFLWLLKFKCDLFFVKQMHFNLLLHHGCWLDKFTARIFHRKKLLLRLERAYLEETRIAKVVAPYKRDTTKLE